MQFADVGGVVVLHLARQIDETLVRVALDQMLHVRQRDLQHVGHALPALVAGVGLGIENVFRIQHDVFGRHADRQRLIVAIGDHGAVGRHHLGADRALVGLIRQLLVLQQLQIADPERQQKKQTSMPAQIQPKRTVE